jgi:hypothetical protein
MYQHMGIFTLWLMCRMKDELEQIRLNQLTPVQRAAEAKASTEEEISRRCAALVIVISVVGLLIVSWIASWIHGG